MLDVLVQDMSEMWIKPSIPSSRPTERAKIGQAFSPSMRFRSDAQLSIISRGWGRLLHPKKSSGCCRIDVQQPLKPDRPPTRRVTGGAFERQDDFRHMDQSFRPVPAPRRPVVGQADHTGAHGSPPDISRHRSMDRPDFCLRPNEIRPGLPIVLQAP